MESIALGWASTGSAWSGCTFAAKTLFGCTLILLPPVTTHYLQRLKEGACNQPANPRPALLRRPGYHHARILKPCLRTAACLPACLPTACSAAQPLAVLRPLVSVCRQATLNLRKAGKSGYSTVVLLRPAAAHAPPTFKTLYTLHLASARIPVHFLLFRPRYSSSSFRR